MAKRLAIAVALLLAIVACSPSADEPEVTETIETTSTTERPLPTTAPPLREMELTSPAFADGDSIPIKFTCDGANVSPELTVRFAPPGTVTLALIVDDPDAPVGVWDHWVEFDIPRTQEDETWPEDAGRIGVPGVNSWNLEGYGGPCPPEGRDHRYFFTVYALRSELLVPEGVDSTTLRRAMEDEILAEAVLMGTYSR
jgi:Raf kinase inhibitor-like YbhB/YbcL family protein